MNLHDYDARRLEELFLTVASLHDELADLRAKLAALRARAAEADAMWECSGCGAHFSPLARLPDGADPNTGANRCTRCVEVEALGAKLVEQARAITPALKDVGDAYELIHDQKERIAALEAVAAADLRLIQELSGLRDTRGLDDRLIGARFHAAEAAFHEARHRANL